LGLSKLSIWIRDPRHPLHPYMASGHSFRVRILTADLVPLHFGPVHNGMYNLTHPGPMGGRVHGQVEVPPGCYFIIGYAPCFNVVTDLAMTQVGCDQEVCVNLLPKHMHLCILYLVEALHHLQKLGPRYKTGAIQPLKLPERLLENTLKNLEELGNVFPKEEMLEALRVSEADLKDIMDEAKPQ